MERFQFSLTVMIMFHTYTHKHYLPTYNYIPKFSKRKKKKICYRKDAVTCNINSLFKFRLVIR